MTVLLLLPFLAIILGYLTARTLKRVTPGVNYLLAFSGAFLLSIIFFELLPELFATGAPHISEALMIGMLLQIALDYFSKGA